MRRIIVNKATVTRWLQLMEAEKLEIYCFLLTFRTRFSGETIQAGQCRLVKCYNMVQMLTARWRLESKCLIFKASLMRNSAAGRIKQFFEINLIPWCNPTMDTHFQKTAAAP